MTRTTPNYARKIAEKFNKIIQKMQNKNRIVSNIILIFKIIKSTKLSELYIVRHLFAK